MAGYFAALRSSYYVRTNIAELFAGERCSQAILNLLVTTDVGRKCSGQRGLGVLGVGVQGLREHHASREEVERFGKEE